MNKCSTNNYNDNERRKGKHERKHLNNNNLCTFLHFVIWQD